MTAARDVYANLLRDTRGLRREQSKAREGWYERLTWEDKEETLFELEMLLKGLACFANPRNHPGRPNAEPPAAHDYRGELRVLQDVLARALHCVRQLLGERERAFVFTRYLETVLPEDQVRQRLLKDQLAQDTPEESLLVLRNTFTAFHDVAEGLLRLPRVSHRLYDGLVGTVVREIGRNTYFDPLVALEFRPELDRIRHPEVLEVLHTVDEAAHKVVAVAFLALFRGLRYAALVDVYASDPASVRRAYAILAVFRSDMRALARYLGRHASSNLADAFERELLTVPAHALAGRHEELSHRAGRLFALRGTLEGLANALRVEIRKVYERELPPLDETTFARGQDAELGAQIVLATASLRATLHHAVRALCTELAPSSEPPELASESSARREASERLRRDVWMFLQVLRAFLAKAEAATEDPDRWASHASFHFVREFLEHFRAIGYQLVRASDYSHLDRFLAALDSLRDVDLLDPRRLRGAIDECIAFYGFLDELFRNVSRRAELQGVPFDKKRAAETLKIYLGAA
ncbi:MAG: hypothetical protein H6721_04460 [Sandaracinus sp.]|nr:hypothetical protein [Myxococcales bacterium]MCB9616957.1 hypothetical protein [Sandaracinus sp.]MCB9631378.1 hypothetical protein [Sandaracinus sp.]